MRSWMTMFLSCVSLLLVQQLTGFLALPSKPLSQLPAPREPPDREKHQKVVPAIRQTLVSPPMTDVKMLLRTLQRKRRRARRTHAPRFMRVGCSLGTCQVQNLNHRLWQLMGQAGKENAPIQLSNPHSFG